MTLKQKLDYHYKMFDKSAISPDPLQFLHLFPHQKDIEAIGFIASIFAYGNVKQIIAVLSSIVSLTKNSPYNFVVNFNSHDSQKVQSIKHRFYTGKDIISLFKMMKKVYWEYDSLKNFFMEGYRDDEPVLKNAISSFSEKSLKVIGKINNEITPGLKFMFPDPEKGSACKRMNLYLRWMIRKDELDFGIWNEIPPYKLVIPVDTHVARVCRALHLTKRKNVSWKMAEEITRNLRSFDPDDPVKYDFAICHIGMRKLRF